MHVFTHTFTDSAMVSWLLRLCYFVAMEKLKTVMRRWRDFDEDVVVFTQDIFVFVGRARAFQILL